MITKISQSQISIQNFPNAPFLKILLFPLVRISIVLLFITPVIILHIIFVKYLLEGISEPYNSILYFSETIIFIILLYYSYSLYTKYVESREPLEFNSKKWIYEYASGLTIGGGIIIFIVLMLSVSGFYHVEHINSPFVLVTSIFRYSIGAFIEELIFTIILYKLVEEFAGSVVSIIVTSLLFGFMHYGNYNATVLSSLYTAIAHILLLAPFILTRRIWMIWGLHFGWNFFQTGVFGINNSGMVQDGFITAKITGPEWLTGGEYGVEISYLSLIIQVIIAVLIMKQAIKSRQLVKASWRKNSKQKRGRRLLADQN